MVADHRLTEQGKPREVTGRMLKRQDDQLYSYFAKVQEKETQVSSNVASSLLSGNTAHPLTLCMMKISLSSSLVGSPSGGPTTH